MAKQTLTHVLPNGRVITRTTARAYSHVIECRIKDIPENRGWVKSHPELFDAGSEWSQWFVWGWAGRADLAEKEAGKWGKNTGWETRAVLINPEG